MCLALYLVADRPVPTRPFRAESPEFWLEQASDTNRAALADLYPGRHLYYLGSHQRCGCGFGGRPWMDRLRPTREDRAAVQSRIKLYCFLRRERLLPARLYCTWEGDQGTVPDRTVRAGHRRLLDLTFELEDTVEYLLEA